MAASPMPGATAESNPPSPPLPAGTLIFDGDCGFCTKTARWVERRLGDDYRVVPSQQTDLGALGLTGDDVARSAWWIEPDGTRSDEHRCIAKALRAMHGLWPPAHPWANQPARWLDLSPGSWKSLPSASFRRPDKVR